MNISKHQDSLFLPWQAWVINSFYACCLIVICLWVEPLFNQRLSSFWLDYQDFFIDEFEFTQTFLVTTQQGEEVSYYLNRKLILKDELIKKLSIIKDSFTSNEQTQPLIALDLDPRSTVASQQELLNIIKKLELRAALVSLR